MWVVIGRLNVYMYMKPEHYTRTCLQLEMISHDLSNHFHDSQWSEIGSEWFHKWAPGNNAAQMRFDNCW